MATESPNDMVCKYCGCEISIVKEPRDGSGYFRSTTYCPVCSRTTESAMIKRSETKPRLSPHILATKFNVRDYADQRKISERFQHAHSLVKKVSRSGTLGSSTVYTVRAEVGSDNYVVTKRGGFWTCNCPDHVFRHLPCKHIIAAMLWEELNGINPLV